MRWYPAGDGHTPIDPDEARDLLLPVSTRAQLDAVEQAGIVEALAEAYGRAALADELLTVSGLLGLHRMMFSGIWRWAGQPRRSEKNIGVAPHQILVQLKAACEDAALWFADPVTPPRESAALLHHRLVKIHVFPNGNGRHARAAVDLLLFHRGLERLAWPLDRAAYIAALRAADVRRFDALVKLLTG